MKSLRARLVRGDPGGACDHARAHACDRRGADAPAGRPVAGRYARAARRRPRSRPAPERQLPASGPEVSARSSLMVAGAVGVRDARPERQPLERRRDEVPGQGAALLVPHDPEARPARSAAGLGEVGGVASVPRRPAARRARRRRARGRALVPARAVDRRGRCSASRLRRVRSPPTSGTSRSSREGTTELASLAEAFNQMVEQLAASRDAERAFLLSVSHELKTPLTAIRGYAEGLAEGAFDPDEAARVITTESGRLERLVRDLLDLARMNRCEFSVRSRGRSISQRSRARRRAGTSRPRASSASSCARSRTRRGSSGDADRVLQIASNLVENALRETPAGGTVTVEADGPRLVVSDTGAGHPGGGCAARVRALLPLRQDRARPADRERARPRDRASSSRPRWAARSASRAAPAARRSR